MNRVIKHINFISLLSNIIKIEMMDRVIIFFTKPTSILQESLTFLYLHKVTPYSCIIFRVKSFPLHWKKPHDQSVLRKVFRKVNFSSVKHYLRF